MTNHHFHYTMDNSTCGISWHIIRQFIQDTQNIERCIVWANKHNLCLISETVLVALASVYHQKPLKQWLVRRVKGVSIYWPGIAVFFWETKSSAIVMNIVSAENTFNSQQERMLHWPILYPVLADVSIYFALISVLSDKKAGLLKSHLPTFWIISDNMCLYFSGLLIFFNKINLGSTQIHHTLLQGSSPPTHYNSSYKLTHLLRLLQFIHPELCSLKAGQICEVWGEWLNVYVSSCPNYSPKQTMAALAPL